MSVGRHSAASAAATVTSAQSCYWLPTILAPCSQISELALGYTVAMVRGLSAYGEKKERKEKRRFLHSGPDFVPTRNAGYEQLFQLVTFKRPTKGMFLKSQLDQSLIKYRGGSKIASQCNTGKFKIPQNLFSSLKYVQKYRSLLKRENINLICLMFLILALMLQFPNAHRLNIATLSPLGNVDSAWKGFE